MGTGKKRPPRNETQLITYHKIFNGGKKACNLGIGQVTQFPLVCNKNAKKRQFCANLQQFSCLQD